jgi:hypothetical protein
VFFDGQHVGHQLARMAVVGQTVDHRHLGVFGELEQGVVAARPQHDRVDIARQHPRGIGDGFAAAELAVVGAERDHVAAELGYRQLE